MFEGYEYSNIQDTCRSSSSKSSVFRTGGGAAGSAGGGWLDWGTLVRSSLSTYPQPIPTFRFDVATASVLYFYKPSVIASITGDQGRTRNLSREENKQQGEPVPRDFNDSVCLTLTMFNYTSRM
ncbi:hypothetical protein M0802_004884 [Mischocyttarus mexicanus]|nr:hypothetical protein M0802_004884 [Mischocyttarus mexicanus]